MYSNPSDAGSSRQRDKVPISRLGPPPPLFKKSERNQENRVMRACKQCRKRKSKCSGDVPRCSNCQMHSLECVYEQTRRDRLREATHLNHTLAALLRDLSERVDIEDKRMINDALDDAADDLISQGTSSSRTSLGKRPQKQSVNESDQETEPHGEAHITASAGSNEDLDHIDEDLLRNPGSRATGYVGQNSEIQWLSSVQRQTEYEGAEPRDQPYGPPGSGGNAVSARSDALHERRNNAKEASRQSSTRRITDFTFYLDNDDIDWDIVVDPHEIPDFDVAERLFNSYLETVHPFFPLVPETFEPEFRKYLKSLRHKGAYKVSQSWRAQMNLLFAIGAKHSHLIGAEWRGEERDHLLYMTRAVHLLDLKNTVMIIATPDIDLVQATGALSFYFLTIGHMSRAWVMIGVSIRLAVALGLHLRNEDPAAGTLRKESLVHTWWSLHSIECLVSTIIGRPPVIAFEDCTVPLPHSSPGEHRNSGGSARKIPRRRTENKSPHTTSNRNATEADRHHSEQKHYLIDHIKVTLISQKVLLNLFSPRTAAQSWEFIQKKMSELLRELEEWAGAALPELSRPGNRKQYSRFEREQFLLRTEYWSVKMLITRPCLCRMERRIHKESNTSANFNIASAETCVEAALEMVKLFPDEPDIDFVYSRAPWWAVVHLLIQAMAVLLLEVTYECRNAVQSNPNVKSSIKKLIRWLRAMQDNDPVACKAYKVVWNILKASAPPLQAQVNDLLAFDTTPAANPQAHRYVETMYDGQPTEHWLRSDFRHNPMHTGEDFDPESFHYQPADDLSSYRNNLSPFNPVEEHLTPMPFGNPFFTSFDQDAAFANMWANSGPSNPYDPDLPQVDISQNPPEDEFDLSMEHIPE